MINSQMQLQVEVSQRNSILINNNDNQSLHLLYLLGNDQQHRLKFVNELRNQPQKIDNKEIKVCSTFEVTRRINPLSIDIVELPLRNEFQLNHMFRGIIYILEKDEIIGEGYLESNCRVSPNSFVSSQIYDPNSSNGGQIKIGEALRRMFKKSMDREIKKNKRLSKQSLPILIFTSFYENPNHKKIKKRFEICLAQIFFAFKEQFEYYQITCNDLIGLYKWMNSDSLREGINNILNPQSTQSQTEANLKKTQIVEQQTGVQANKSQTQEILQKNTNPVKKQKPHRSCLLI